MKRREGTAHAITSSRPPHCVSPRPNTDPHRRLLDYGPIQPMQRPSLLRRIFGRV